MGCCYDSSVAPEEDEEDMDGPLDDRSCTDIIFFVLFGAFLVGMFILFGMGVNQGDPYRLLKGTDVAGNVCGETNDPIPGVNNSGLSLQGKKYLYFDWVRTASILGDQTLESVLKDNNIVGNFTEKLGAVNFGASNKIARDFCISDAYQLSTAKLEKDSSASVYNLVNNEFEFFNDPSPRHDIHGVVLKKKKLTDDSEIVSLIQHDGNIKVYKTSKATVSGDSVTSLLSDNPITSVLSGGKVCRYCVETCPDDYEPLFESKCVPKSLSGGASSLLSGSGISSLANELGHDFAASQRELGLMGLTALLLSILMTIAFRFAAGFIVYIIIALVVVASVGGTIALWVIWWLKKGNLAEQEALLSTVNSTGLSAAQEVTQSITTGITAADSKEEVYAWLTGAIFASIITLIILVVLLILRKRIALVVTLFHEAGKAVHAMPYLVFVPLLTFLALAVTVTLWMYGGLWIISAGDPVVDNTTTYVKFQPDTFMSWMTLYHIFGGLWITQFIIACQHLVIAGSVAGWYFSKDKSSVGVQTVIASFWRLIRYHLGTAAFGSLIIAIIQMIRLILAYVQYMVNKYKNKGGAASRAAAKVAECILCCLQCILDCFERFMKFINMNAYIETAIYGYNFCRAAMKAFQLLTANALRVVAINSIGTFVLFLGKIVVVIGSGVISYYILKDNKEVQHFWPQIFISMVFAYIVAHAFVGVYEMAIDTIFLCFCEDSSRNDGINKPYYMSRELMQFVENSKKALDALDQKKEMKQNEDKHMMVQERRHSDDDIALVDVD